MCEPVLSSAGSACDTSTAAAWSTGPSSPISLSYCEINPRLCALSLRIRRGLFLTFCKERLFTLPFIPHRVNRHSVATLSSGLSLPPPQPAGTATLGDTQRMEGRCCRFLCCPLEPKTEICLVLSFRGHKCPVAGVNVSVPHHLPAPLLPSSSTSIAHGHSIGQPPPEKPL